MATTTVARYATAGGAVTEVTRHGGLLRITTYAAACSGCHDGIAIQVNPNVLGGIGPEAEADQWASQHAPTCRRTPS